MANRLPPPLPGAPARKLVAPRPSLLGRLVKSILWLVLLGALLWPVWVFAVAPWYWQALWEQGGRQLPGCESPYVVQELRARYAPTSAFWQSMIPDGLSFSLRRARKMDSPHARDLLRCAGEYSSPVGSGPIGYTVAWFDPNDPSPDRLVVTVVDIGGPEMVTKLFHAFGK